MTDTPKTAPAVPAGERSPVIDMTISADGVARIKEREGLVLTAYEDSGSTRTIGYGHTGGVREGETITQIEALELLYSDLSHVHLIMCHTILVQLAQHEYDALASFIFNIGEDAFRRSTVLKYLNRGLYRDAAMHMSSWCKVDHKVSKGLWQRRKSEIRQFRNDATVI